MNLILEWIWRTIQSHVQVLEMHILIYLEDSERLVMQEIKIGKKKTLIWILDEHETMLSNIRIKQPRPADTSFLHFWFLWH